MKRSDLEVLSNKEIPEAIRAKMAEHLLTFDDRTADRELEIQKQRIERNKFLWNTPIVAALAGLLTLSATFIFQRITTTDETRNTITLEQVRNELEESEARLKQELENSASETLAKLEADAREREFQYDIVRTHLTDSDKTNAERAAILLFLVRAGVLSSLNHDELREMAQQQIDSPTATIIPRLTSTRDHWLHDPLAIEPDLVSDFNLAHPVHLVARSVGKLTTRQIERGTTTCTAFLVAKDKIATAKECVGADYLSMEFELYPDGTGPSADILRFEIANEPPQILQDDGKGGYAILRLAGSVTNSIAPLPLDGQLDSEDLQLFMVYFGFGGVQYTDWNTPHCRAQRWDATKIYHQCSTLPGSTGGPIIDRTTSNVVAVHSGSDGRAKFAYRIVQ